MATTVDSQTTTGVSQYTFSFPYLEQSDVVITVDGAAQTLGTAYVFTATNQITFQPGFIPTAGLPIIFQRKTAAETLPVDFSAGTSLRAVDLNSNFKQNLYIAQETQNLTVDASSGALADGSITTAKIATGAVTSAKIATGAIFNDDVNVGAGIVYGKLVLDNSIVDADINTTAAITGTKIQQANTTTRGTVQLTNSLTSTSEELATSALAAKTLATTEGLDPITTSVSANIAAGQWVSVDTAGRTITLPETPTNGQKVRVSVGDFTNTTIARATISQEKIMNDASDLTIDVANTTVTLIYDSFNSFGWRIV